MFRTVGSHNYMMLTLVDSKYWATQKSKGQGHGSRGWRANRPKDPYIGQLLLLRFKNMLLCVCISKVISSTHSKPNGIIKLTWLLLIVRWQSAPTNVLFYLPVWYQGRSCSYFQVDLYCLKFEDEGEYGNPHMLDQCWITPHCTSIPYDNITTYMYLYINFKWCWSIKALQLLRQDFARSVTHL